MSLAIVTGANRGIGLELCRQLAARGQSVIAACRRPSNELAKLGVEVVAGIDVAEPAGAEQLAKAVGQRSVALIINNAGILHDEELGALDFDAIQRQFVVNALGPLRVTEALLERLERGAKVALITSRMGSMADNGSGGSYGYRMSKAALNAAGVSLARDLAPRGVAVVLLHPGYVRTEMTNGAGHVEPAEAARGLLERIDALSPSTTGSFLHINGERLPW